MTRKITLYFEKKIIKSKVCIILIIGELEKGSIFRTCVNQDIVWLNSLEVNWNSNSLKQLY